MATISETFERALEALRNESDAAVQFFYAWQTIHAVAASNSRVHKALNNTPLFWNTNLGALQTALMITLGRIFDPDTANHSVTRVLTIAHQNQTIFSKEELGKRKQSGSTNANEWLGEYLRDAYVPSNEDFRRLKRYVAKRRKTYEAIYRPIRHQHFAHRSASAIADVHSLFAKADTRELQQLLIFLRRLHDALWQLYFNGRKPVLRPARYSVKRIRHKPSPYPDQAELQERMTHETEQILRSLP